jgi:sugar phosphate isomerase/epimerase
MIKPLEPNQVWAEAKKEIQSWGFPVRGTSHWISGGSAIGPNRDLELQRFYVQRALARASGLGAKICGVYGAFFPVPEESLRTTATDQALRYFDMVADEAERFGIMIALEPMGNEKTVCPLYLDAVEFCRRLGRWNVRCMADTDYFVSRNQPLENIAKYPEYCVMAETQGVKGQPGFGDRVDIHTRLFRVLRDIGYEGVVDFVAGGTWHNTSGSGPADLRVETRKSLEYAQKIRDQVYAE